MSGDGSKSSWRPSLFSSRKSNVQQNGKSTRSGKKKGSTGCHQHDDHHHHHQHRHHHHHGHHQTHHLEDGHILQSEPHSSNGKRLQIQKQKQMRSQLLERRQLWLEDSKLVLGAMDGYLDEALRPKPDKQKVSDLNERVNTKLTLLKMKARAMRRNAKAQGIDFGEAFDMSWALITEYEDEREDFMLKKVEPLLNYMKAIVLGQKLPRLPYVDDGGEFDPEDAAEVLGAIVYQKNHGLPDTLKNMAENAKGHRAEQKKLKREFDRRNMRSKQRRIAVNVDSMCSDYNGPKGYAPSAKEQEFLSNREHRELKAAPPAHLCPELEGHDDVDMFDSFIE